MKKRILEISLLTMMIFSLTACGDSKESSKQVTTKANIVFSETTTETVENTKEDMETYLKNSGIISGERTEKMASMIGANSGFSYPNSDVEIYEYDTDSDVYKSILDTGKVKMDGFGDLEVTAVNGKYILLSSSQSAIEAFKNYGNNDAKNKTYSKDEVKSEESQDEFKSDVYSYVVDIWNDGFCNVYHYLEDGKNAEGKEMDINTTISHIDRLYSDIDKYDKISQKIEDVEFVELWNNERGEIDKLYNRIKDETPRANDSTYVFDYSEFQDIMYDLMDKASD